MTAMRTPGNANTPYDYPSQGDHNDSSMFYPVIIIGAGISGIAAACQLKEKLGFDQFTIFEREEGIGGTWFIHQYPGVACDIPAPLYTFSFAQNLNWSTLKPSGKEILEYLRNVCERYHIVENIRLNTEVTDLQWNDEREEWEARITRLMPQHLGSVNRTSYTFTVRAKIVITAVGKFLEPKIAGLQHVPGVHQFEGDIIHTARWKKSVNLQGKNVVVVGTGASAAQLVPELMSSHINILSLTQLMRSPPWVSPNYLTEANLKRWEKYMPWLLRNIPWLIWIVRLIIFAITEYNYFHIFNVNKSVRVRRAREERKLLAYMRRTVPGKYHDLLSPDYEIGCKRVIHDDRWFKTLQQETVTLSSMTLKRVERKAVILESRCRGSDTAAAGPGPEKDEDRSLGELRVPADAIVLATGYNMMTLMQSISITGRDATDIQELWKKRGGPQAYLTLALDKFPNLFFIGGPNTANGHSSDIILIENTVQHVLKLVRPILYRQVSVLEVKEEACLQWTRDIQKASEQSVWVSGSCRSWYIDEKGWNGMVYPYSQLYSTYRLMFPVWKDWEITYTTEDSSGPGRRRSRITGGWIISLLIPLIALLILRSGREFLSS